MIFLWIDLKTQKNVPTNISYMHYKILCQPCTISTYKLQNLVLAKHVLSLSIQGNYFYPLFRYCTPRSWTPFKSCGITPAFMFLVHGIITAYENPLNIPWRYSFMALVWYFIAIISWKNHYILIALINLCLLVKGGRREEREEEREFRKKIVLKV